MAYALVQARAGTQAVCIDITVVLLVGAYIDYLLTELPAPAKDPLPTYAAQLTLTSDIDSESSVAL